MASSNRLRVAASVTVVTARRFGARVFGSRHGTMQDLEASFLVHVAMLAIGKTVRPCAHCVPSSASIPSTQGSGPFTINFSMGLPTVDLRHVLHRAHLQSASAAALASKGRGCLVEEPVLMTITSNMVVLSLSEPIPRAMVALPARAP